MTKVILRFNRLIKQGYVEVEGKHADKRNNVLQEHALRAIKGRLKWLSKLTDEKLLEYCKIEEEK